MRTIIKYLSAACVVFLCMNSSVSAQPIQADSAKTILFVGNSLTYANDLPRLVERVGKEKGIVIKTDMIAYANYGLEDHWNDGQLQKTIANKHYDFVVVQQGPSSQSEGRTMLLDYGAKIKAECNKYHTQLAFYMVWPAVANINNFNGVINNYADAATATNSLLCPVGEAWKKQVEKGDYSYYGSDLFHPSIKGTEVAAGIIVATLFKDILQAN